MNYEVGNMDNQEMQFADPAWQPSQQRGDAATPQQSYTPQPINPDGYEQVASTYVQPDETYANSAYASGYHAQPQQGKVLRPIQRRRFGPLFWIIGTLIIIALMGGGMQWSFGDGGRDFPSMPMSQQQPFEKMGPVQTFSVGIHPTIVVNDPNDDIHVHSGGDVNTVAVQVTDMGAGAPNIQQGSNGSLIITGANSDRSAHSNIDITVANEADLVLNTTSGNIDVQGVDGQMQLTSEDGSITLTQVALARNSVVKADSGSITFGGSLDPQGTSQFETGSGTVDVTLPADASYHLHVISNGGTFNSDFPLNLPLSNDNTFNVKTDVGKSPSATLTLTTASGSINLLQAK
jgi:DUF4097 and DUF4098 domain-containing protein YvlB